MTTEDQPALKVIDGGKTGACCSGNAKSEDVFPPLQASTGSASEDEKVLRERIERHKLDRLRVKHSKELFEAELAVQELKLTQAFELILFEAATNGVPYRTVEESHSEAAEQLERVMGEVS